MDCLLGDKATSVKSYLGHMSGLISPAEQILEKFQSLHLTFKLLFKLHINPMEKRERGDDVINTTLMIHSIDFSIACMHLYKHKISVSSPLRFLRQWVSAQN